MSNSVGMKRLAAGALAGCILLAGTARGQDAAPFDANAAYEQAKATAPGGPWKLVATTDHSLVLVKTDDIDHSYGEGTAASWILTIMRPPKFYQGMGTVALMLDHPVARCSDDAERSLALKLSAPDGTVLADGPEGLRPDFKTHDPQTIFNQTMHIICHPETADASPGYPTAEAAVAALSGKP